MQSPVDSIRRFLAFTVAQFAEKAILPNLLLKHGREFKTDEHSFIGGTRHQCYKNATLAALGDHNLTYCEGYVLVHGVPIEHAWTITADGIVRDVTLRDSQDIGGYYGIAFQRRFVNESMRRNKTYGLLCYDNRQRLMKTKPHRMFK